ncbi:hypothetical protein GCM10007036_22300 [Alsobacter metallidurans]|uniref:Lipoprotein n=2 Tax=Alsobacter metallidurans TaxID=340221 RepID=A0A917I6F1_9HYPH|nr:hypothetical protein GCM10007036_22300 [Alsobacter metallidurans]
MLAAMGLAGCAPAPPAYLAAPMIATPSVRPVRADPVTAGLGRFEIVEPKGWDALNRNVTPKGGSHAP